MPNGEAVGPCLLLRLQLASMDMAALRQRAREVAELVQLETLRVTRFTTAVSEIARNAREFAGGGSLEFLLDDAPGGRQCLVASVQDQGPGIADVDAALAGHRLPTGRMSNGLPGSRKLVDRMTITSPARGGTLVRLEMDLAPGRPVLSPVDAARLSAELASRQPASPHQELEQQNQELLKIHQALLDKQKALEQADERKNQFVKTLVHELRTPLSTLNMTVAALQRKPDIEPAELLRRCEVMGRQTDQLTRLVDQLMDVARVSQGKIALDLEPTDLNVLVAGALEMTGGSIAAKGHDIRLAPSAEPLWVRVDRSRMTQVLCNLIQNAARYTPERGEIRVSVHAEGGRCRVEVRDNGIGIEGDLLPYVFDLFVQGNSKASHSEGGLGIGLTLVHHLVALHGGEVGVESEGADKGSTFAVTLPLVHAVAAERSLA